MTFQGLARKAGIAALGGAMALSSIACDEEKGPAPAAPDQVSPLPKVAIKSEGMALVLTQLDDALVATINGFKFNRTGTTYMKADGSTIRDLRNALGQAESRVRMELSSGDATTKLMLFDYLKSLGEARGAVAWTDKLGNVTELPDSSSFPLHGLLAQTRALEEIYQPK